MLRSSEAAGKGHVWLGWLREMPIRVVLWSRGHIVGPYPETEVNRRTDRWDLRKGQVVPFQSPKDAAREQ